MKETPLYDRHVALGAKFTDFGGWLMPVQYTNVIEEHLTTRRQAGLFDICHMGEIEIKGPKAFALLQRVMSRNLDGQATGQIKLSTMTNERGGIIDDLTVYKFNDEHYMIVTNSSTKDKDLLWLQTQRNKEEFSHAEVIDISAKTGKLDLQGPKAQKILQQLIADDLSSLRFYYVIKTEVRRIPAIISRSGYTGEDGFEIYTDIEKTGDIWDMLLTAGTGEGLRPIGLGARDTLRLESGMMLYGHEIDETVTPFEVVYGWLVDLRKDFIGSSSLRRQKEVGPSRKIVGFEMVERGIARAGYPVWKDDREIGRVTSGTYSPTFGRAIGLAFVPLSSAEEGTEIYMQIRNQKVKAKITGLPFYRREK